MKGRRNDWICQVGLRGLIRQLHPSTARTGSCPLPSKLKNTNKIQVGFTQVLPKSSGWLEESVLWDGIVMSSGFTLALLWDMS